MWSIGDDFTIWTDNGVLIEATPSLIRVGARLVARDDVADVATFVDESRCHRGVRLDLRDGSTVIVVEERDDTPELEPTYGRDMLLFDTHWAGMLGSRLATFLAVEYVDGI
jgi:hypothetical protein